MSKATAAIILSGFAILAATIAGSVWYVVDYKPTQVVGRYQAAVITRSDQEGHVASYLTVLDTQTGSVFTLNGSTWIQSVSPIMKEGPRKTPYEEAIEDLRKSSLAK